MAEPSAARRGTVQAVERSARVLETLAMEAVPMSALELSRRIGLNRTVTHRLLRTLAQSGLVSEDQGRYVLGDMTAHLGYAYVDALPFRRPALMYGTDLALQVVDRPWMVSLAVPVRDYVMIVDRIWEPKTPLNTILDIGTRLEFDGSALGRTILAYMDDDAAIAVIGRKRFGAVSSRLATIRDDGGVDVAVDEVQPGVVGVASAVLDPRGRPAGAIAIAGPSSDRELAEGNDVVLRVQLAARNIGRALPGFSAARHRGVTAQR